MSEEYKNQTNGLLTQLDTLLEKVGGDFGPVLMAELQQRMDQTIKIFNIEVKELLEDTFQSHHLTHDQVNEFINNAEILETPPSAKADDSNLNVPQFISDYEEKLDKKQK